ncbi:MAG TPA: acyl-CoA dehydrogenase family protein [Phenylobacterium sp.]|uniref:acyl-CoA dehydrogenase family protein n=1 Tax=Phenylobacterium sp. TaxID=1871053 RepID=UPI002B48BB11|nr:acyl-CoA dehydrogenase family protein [Phenylobacterium sp.]HKR88591.1 acyl-CoA dehydrogenase family protein [Phenylobacterium sp.]
MASAQHLVLDRERASGAELVARAAAFAKVSLARAESTEKARRVSEQAIDEMESHGLTSLLRPQRWQGLETDWRTFVDTVIAGSAGCGSTGWLLSLLNTHQWFLAQFPEAAQESVWGETPNARIATSFTPTKQVTVVDGGIRISGRWKWSSGIDVCNWAMLGALLPPPSGKGPPKNVICLVRRPDFQVIDTWYNVGLRGTGSNDVVVDDVFIPNDHMLDLSNLREGVSPGNQINTSNVYRLPMYTAIPLSIASPAIGMAIGGRDLWVEETKEKVSSATGEQMSAQLPLQLRLSEADTELDIARMLLHRVTDILERGSVTLPERYRNRRDFTYAVRLACSAVDKLFQMGGARGLVDSSPFQRVWRDVHAASCHIALAPDIANENYGRCVLGLDRNPADPFF